MVKGFYVLHELRAEKPTDKRHQHLEAAEEYRDYHKVRPLQFFHFYTLADRDRKSVHRKRNTGK
jgi:hypothetical protein